MNQTTYPVFPAKGKKDITVPRQLGLFEETVARPMLHVSMGYFYELLTTALFGGVCQTNIYRNDTDEDDDGLIKPDVVTNRNHILESKANRSGHQLLLLDSQIDRYRYLQSRHPAPRIYFVIWRHIFANVKSFKGSENDLWHELSRKTVLGVVLPFSIILRMHDHGSSGENPLLTIRYDNRRFSCYNCVRIRSPFTNSFYDNPDAAIASIGLEPKMFRWRRWNLPKVTINMVTVQRFPLVVIHDLDHDKWVSQFNPERGLDCPF